MFNKAQLAERGRHYFDDQKINKMYATTDGNFFYERDKSYADSHAKGLKTSVIEITRGDLASKEVKPKVVTPPVEPVNNSPTNDKPESSENGLSIEELRAEGKRLKIPKYWVIKEKTLKKKIAEANGST